MIQDQFLAAIQKARVPVTIYLVSGIRLQGTVESSDQYGVLLGGNSQQFIFKRAISTIVPSSEVSHRGTPASTDLHREAAKIHSSNAEVKPDLSEGPSERMPTGASSIEQPTGKLERSSSTIVVRVKRAGRAKLKPDDGNHA
jgi:host factor-I protein